MLVSVLAPFKMLASIKAFSIGGTSKLSIIAKTLSGDSGKNAWGLHQFCNGLIKP